MTAFQLQSTRSAAVEAAAAAAAAANNSDHSSPTVTAIKAPDTQTSPHHGTSDLLGLSGGAGAANSNAYSGILVDVLGDLQSGGAELGRNGGGGGFDSVIGSAFAEDTFQKFVCKNNGVLFENDLLQVSDVIFINVGILEREINPVLK